MAAESLIWKIQGIMTTQQCRYYFCDTNKFYATKIYPAQTWRYKDSTTVQWDLLARRCFGDLASHEGGVNYVYKSKYIRCPCCLSWIKFSCCTVTEALEKVLCGLGLCITCLQSDLMAQFPQWTKPHLHAQLSLNLWDSNPPVNCQITIKIFPLYGTKNINFKINADLEWDLLI